MKHVKIPHRLLGVGTTVPVLCFIAAAASGPLMADTHDVASGEKILSNVTETSRTVKTGAGTLTLTGENTLGNGLQVEGGTLKFNGGTTTVTCSTGGGSTDANLAPFSQKGGSAVIVEGGATVDFSVSDTSKNYYAVGWAGDLLVTNGVFNIHSIELLNGFYVPVGGRGRLIVQDEGVFKSEKRLRVTQTGTASETDNVGLFLNKGGVIHVPSLYVEGTRYGVIRYNGGTVNMTANGNLYTYNKVETEWNTVKSYVHEGGFRLVNDTGSNQMNLNMPLLSGVDEGAKDGGVHYSSSKGRFISPTGLFANSTFNGGTHLEGNVTLANYLNDAAFGAVPATPTDNIFFSGDTTLFGGSANHTTHPNRNVRIAAGTTATFGCNNSGTGFRIGGEINVPDEDDSAMNTMVKAGNASWGGFVVFDPGEGRTNRLDRLHVVRNLEIASGVTIVRSPSKGTETAAPLYVEGNDSAYTSGDKAYGNLRVSGGKLLIEGNRYFQAHKYAHVIVDGGTVSALATNCEYLNGLANTPATLTVENGGVFEVYNLRVSQSGSSGGSDINVNTGGVVRTAYFSMDNSSVGRINLNGGTIAVYSDGSVTDKDKTIFLGGRKNDSVWANVTVRVLAGGAKFDTAGHSRSVNMPLLSAVGQGATDGGLTKLGEGTLTMTKTSTYNGPTRLAGGTLTFTDVDDESERGGRPDTDIEFTAEALMADGESPLLTAPSLGMGAGKVIRVVGCEKLDGAKWTGRRRVVATFDKAVGELPDILFVRSDGTVASTNNGWCNWMFSIGRNGRNIEFRRLSGMALTIR
jgi:autotransporter-associated beta strand protein